MNKLILFVLLSHSITAFAQIEKSRDVYAAAGAQFSNQQMQLDFTIGEVLTSTLTNNFILTQGFQQSKQQTVGIKERNDAAINIYPNPASSQITFTTSVRLPYTFKIIDVCGKIIIEGNNQENILNLDISKVQNGLYFFEYTLENTKTISSSFIISH